MKLSKTWLLLSLAILVTGGGTAWWLRQYLQGAPTPVTPFAGYQLPVISLDSTTPPSSLMPTGSPEQAVINSWQPAKSYRAEVVTENLDVPWSIVFTSPERMLVSERPGQVRAIVNGQLQTQPLVTITDISTKSEEGLMGLTLDPNYTQTKWVYGAYAYPKNPGLVVKVVRWRDDGNQLTQATTIIDNIPAAQFHAGCRLRFGPDGKLYVTTGDATDKNLAQNQQSVAGKILRLNADGSFPADNPLPNSPVWSWGHRNPQGLDWHPVSGQLVATEHGPSGFDGPGGGDEVNLIVKGGNYGWPVVSHEKNQDGFIPPLLVYTPAVAPASGTFYNGTIYPELQHNFLFGGLRGEGLFRVWFDPANPYPTARYEKMTAVSVGRVREVVVGPDGYIYFTSSNRDGRGQRQTGDDKLYRLVPN